MNKSTVRRQTLHIITILALMAGLLAMSFSPVSVQTAQAQAEKPGAAVLVSPKGSSDSVKPAYTWNAVAGVTWYKLWVDGPSGYLFATWYPVADICSSTTCSVTPDLSLTSGESYKWWVLTYNEAGEGAWSDTGTFTPASKLAKPALVSPSGSSDSLKPAYAWNIVSGATWYNLVVEDAAKNPVFTNWYPAADVCSASTCSVTPDVKLAESTTYSWKVRPWSGDGYGPWSDAKTFTTSLALTKPTLVSPSGSSETDQPTFIWNVVSGAPAYKLWVDGPGGNLVNAWFKASDICSSTTCTAKPTAAFEKGKSYTWWVLAGVEASSQGVWSDAKTFTLPKEAAAPMLVSPNGTSSSNKPTYTWNAAEGATSYKLWVDGPSGAVYLAWYKASDVCSGTTCSATPDKDLEAQVAYKWWVLSWMDNGTGKWSEGLQFTTPSALGSSNLFLPQERTSTSPTFMWSSVQDATWYQVSIDGPSGNLYKAWHGSDSVCAGWVCSMKSPVTLQAGNVTLSWKVQSWNSKGYGPWSQPVNFVPAYTPPTPLASPVLVSPISYAYSAKPTFKWNVSTGATRYVLWINSPTSTVYKDWHDAATVCVGSTCSYTPNITLTQGTEYSWAVMAWVAPMEAFDGAWSSVEKFNVDATTHAMQPPQLISPSGITPTQPIYTWGVVPEAIQYKLYVEGPVGKIIDKVYTVGGAELTCGTTCSPVWNPLVLAYGFSYTWWIKAIDSAGNGVWSTPLTFTLYQDYRAIVLQPIKSTSTNSASLVWKQASGSPFYKLELVDMLGNTVINEWCSVLGCTCDSYICRYTTTGLTSTEYKFKVLTWYDATHQYWSGGENPAYGEGTWFRLQETAFTSQFNGSTDRWVSYRGSWANTDGAYFKTNGITWDWASVAYEGQFANADYEVKFYRSADTDVSSETAIIIRGIPPLDPNWGSGWWYEGYLFGITRTGYYYLYKISNGGSLYTLQPLTQCAPLVQGTAWNTMRIRAEGSTLVLYVNDFPILRYGDTLGVGGAALETGAVGILSLNKSTINEYLKVDYARLTQPGFSWFSTSDEVSAEQQALNDAAMKAWLEENGQ